MATSVIVTPPIEPFTLDQAKLRAGLDWAFGDPRDDLMTDFIAAARSKVEQDTGLALLTQTRDVRFDSCGGCAAGPLVLPSQSLPLQQIVSITITDSQGGVSLVDPEDYTVDLGTGRICWLSASGAVVVRIICGWELADLPPLLRHAVGLLIAHYATFGRDVVLVGHIVATTPYGYEEAIQAYCLVTVA